MRVDVPTLRALESAVAADFDSVVGRIMTGALPVVVRGFLLANFGAGTQATAVQLATADSILANLNASQSGSFLWVPANRAVEVLDPSLNSRVSGSWTAGQTNFVGLDLTRDAAASTSDLVEFKNPNTNLEVPKEVPLARVLDYKIVISTTPFSAQPNLVPIAKVVTNGTNQVSSVTDARNMLFRLATGGDNPTNLTTYGWPTGRAQSTLLNSFSGGDRSIASMRDLVQALESRIWEIGGGEDWYSPTADRNVFMANVGTTAPLADYFTWDGTNLLWIGLRFTFENSNYAGVYYNVVSDQTSSSAGLTNLADGECIYVDLVRTSNATLTAVKAVYQTLGVGPTPGARQVIAVRRGADVFTRGARNPVGVPVPPATTTTLGIVKLFQTPGTPLAPVVLNLDANATLAWTSTGGAVALSVTASAGNSDGIRGFGHGSAAGVVGTGQAAGTGDGVQGFSNNASSHGVYGESNNTSSAIYGANFGTGVGVRAFTGGTIAIQSDGYVDMAGGAQPATTTGFANMLTKKSVLKAWGFVTFDGIGGATVQDGFNIASVTLTGAGVWINFATNMGNALYSVTATGENTTVNTPFWVTVGTSTAVKSVSQFFLFPTNAAGGLNFSTLACGVNFAVYARQ